MTTPLQKAAQAVIDRWDSPSWKDQPHTAEYIAELRKALDAEIAQSVEPYACVIGAKGSAFDMPQTKRAYTYAEQPGNIVASKLGAACVEAMASSAGDSIDRGLGLLHELQKEGFGVFDLGAEYAPPQPQATPAVPDGYVLVPIEPTDEELAKGVRAMRLFVTKNSLIDFSLGYKAMIAAAQGEKP